VKAIKVGKEKEDYTEAEKLQSTQEQGELVNQEKSPIRKEKITRDDLCARRMKYPNLRLAIFLGICPQGPEIQIF